MPSLADLKIIEHLTFFVSEQRITIRVTKFQVGRQGVRLRKRLHKTGWILRFCVNSCRHVFPPD